MIQCPLREHREHILLVCVKGNPPLPVTFPLPLMCDVNEMTPHRKTAKPRKEYTTHTTHTSDNARMHDRDV